jgi:hypothetical protein
MTKLGVFLIGSIISTAMFIGEARARDLGQTSFVVPKPKLAVLKAMRNGTIQNMLLATGLDKQLEKEFPSDNPSVPTEIVVQLFVKTLGIPVRVAPITVVRVPGQSWNAALGSSGSGNSTKSFGVGGGSKASWATDSFLLLPAKQEKWKVWII